MINIAICDDEISTTSELEAEICKAAKKNGIGINIDIFFDGSTLENYIKSGHRFDLIYLDIEMKIKNGIDVAKEIRRLDYNVLIIYVSSYESYLKELFEVEAFRFISKPINKNLFYDYFKMACERIGNKELYFQFQFSKEVKKILLRDIIFFESQKRIIYINTIKGKEKFYGKLNDIEKQLQGSKQKFIRIHQSFYVNYNYIVKMNFSKLKLSNGMELQISEDRQKKVRLQFCKLAGEEL